MLGGSAIALAHLRRLAPAAVRRVPLRITRPMLTILLSRAAINTAWGAFFTADWAIAYAVLPRGAMAAAMGVWNLAAAIPQIIAPAITAPLVAYVDARQAGAGPRSALLLAAFEFVLGASLLAGLPALKAAQPGR